MRLGVLMAAVMGASFTRAQETPPAVPAFPAVVELITVDAVVLDRDGRPVPGLTREDFAVSEDGDTYVVQAGPAFKVLGKNSLNEMTLATPAVANGSLIVRTASKLYRIGKK